MSINFCFALRKKSCRKNSFPFSDSFCFHSLRFRYFFLPFFLLASPFEELLLFFFSFFFSIFIFLPPFSNLLQVLEVLLYIRVMSSLLTSSNRSLLISFSPFTLSRFAFLIKSLRRNEAYYERATIRVVQRLKSGNTIEKKIEIPKRGNEYRILEK